MRPKSEILRMFSSHTNTLRAARSLWMHCEGGGGGWLVLGVVVDGGGWWWWWMVVGGGGGWWWVVVDAGWVVDQLE